MRVKLVRRWGPHRADKTVEVSESQGRWLIQHNYAQSSGDVQAPVQPAAAPGGNGEDPLAGADATRLRPRVGVPPRDARVNYASPAAGSSPTYRAGFDEEASKRQGLAGRAQLESDDKPTRSSSKGSDESPDSRKPVRRRKGSSDS